MVSRIDLSDPLRYKPLEGKLNLLEMNLGELNAAEIEQLNALVGLKVVDLSGNNLSALPVEFTGSRETLHTIDLAENRFSEVPRCITNLPQVQTVDLSDNEQLSRLSDAFKSKEFIRVDLRGTGIPVGVCQRLNAIQVFASGVPVIHNSHRGPLAARVTIPRPARYYGQRRFNHTVREGYISRRENLRHASSARRNLTRVFEAMHRQQILSQMEALSQTLAQTRLPRDFR